MNEATLSEVRALADRHCLGLLTEDDVAQLNRLLHNNPAAQRAFLETTGIYARLQWEFAGGMAPAAGGNVNAEVAIVGVVTAGDTIATDTIAGDAIEPVLSTTLVENRTQSSALRTRAAWIAVAAAVLLAIVGIAYRGWNHRERPLAANPPSIDLPASTAIPRSITTPGSITFPRSTAPAIVATLKNTAGARWQAGHAPAAKLLAPMRLRLEAGVAEIEFVCGATAVLKAPADLELIGAKAAFLHAGQVVVRVPHESDAVGFRIETPNSQLVDLGTEFGVEVGTSGGCLLQVYEGEVLASAKAEDPAQAPRRVLEGEALRVDDSLHQTPFWPERFVRLLPGPDDPLGRGNLPYNVSQFAAVEVLPAAPGLTIDGDLADWDRSGQFRAACEPPFADHYYVEAVMMYDAAHVYVGAHVGDPHPMRSQISPRESRDLYGGGGSVALRLSTDRKAGWPLTAESADMRGGRPARPEDVSDQLCFFVLWYCEPEQKACIHLRYGMDLHGVEVNPPGYSGAFRRDADGLGYTLEYAIPWKLLNAADDPPRGGDELAAMWLVHWSDAGGRKWQGQLIDVMQPHEHGWNFQRAATWGKAIYRQAAAPPLPLAPSLSTDPPLAKDSP